LRNIVQAAMATSIIQLADMPVTPLAQHMGRYGWPALNHQSKPLPNLLRTAEATPNHAAKVQMGLMTSSTFGQVVKPLSSSSLAILPPMQRTAALADHSTATSMTRAAATPSTRASSSSFSGPTPASTTAAGLAAGAFADALARSVALAAPEVPRVVPTVGVCAAAGVQQPRVARYESKDPATGRVWGMPNAGGRPQCADCPNRAALPSNRCEGCQIRLANTRHEAMPAPALQQLKDALEACLVCLPVGKKRDDVSDRLHALFAEAEAGRLAPSVVEQLQGLTGAIFAGDRREANKCCAALVSQHWDEHREWLMGLKRLLAQQ